MADAPPSSADNKPSNNQASQVVEPNVNDNQVTKMDSVKEISPPSVFVNSEPIREDQVQNAVKFLSHPKVRGSPVIHRRSFLERKGLTKEEIDEAFRRVPDEKPAVTTVQANATNQDAQVIPSSSVQQQPPTQIVQSAPVGAVSKMGILSGFRWPHAVIAIGFLALSGAGTVVLFKKTLIPKMKSWVRKIVLEGPDGEERALVKKDQLRPSIAEEAAAAAKAAAAAAADVARATQEMTMMQSEDKRYMEELVSMLNMQVQQMKSMTTAIQKLEGQSKPARIVVDDRDNKMLSSRQPYSDAKADTDYRSVRSVSPPVESSNPPHPKSYMEIMEMIQRGEKPSNIREINDAPPNPNQPLSNPRLTPKPKPWEVSQSPSYTNGDETSPWWQSKNVRISEIEPVEEQPKLAAPSSSSSSTSQERPVQRSWVPPQPPPVAMPEAAAAIRQPKKSVSQAEDEQLLSRSSADVDELQRITKISESGGAAEADADAGMGGSGSYEEA